MKWFWDRFLIEGDQLYDYMIKNYENMFDGKLIKHFTIRDGIYGYSDDTIKINEKYGIDIENQLIGWIQKEFNEKRLFQKIDWKPFRDQFNLSSMYFAYRKLFQYRNYYFQFIMETNCTIDNCKYCENDEIRSHFGLAIYGWKDDNSEILQPTENIKIPKDNIMPEIDWIYK
jgi:hypothetical protein